MKPERLKELLSLGENQTVEYKASYQPGTAGKEICAFLNSGGGYLVCGINDKGKVIGLALTDVKKLELEFSRKISPKALIPFATQTLEGKEILVIEVPAGKDVPYAFSNDIFIRVADKTVKADIASIRDMVLRRQTEPERWERRFSDAQIDNDFDKQHFAEVVSLIQKNARFCLRNEQNSDLILEDLAAAKNGQLTNAGDLLFCRNTAKRYPQVRVRAARYNKDKADDAYQDMKHIEGPVLQVLEEVFSFIMRNTPTKASFVSGVLERQNVPMYPPEAIREGLVNAFVHRDYSNFTGGLAVHIYPDKLEIWNSGEFPEGVTAQELDSGHISVLRNPDLAHVFYLRGMMEKMGRGSLLIKKACQAGGLPAPVWRSEKGLGVTLTFTASGTKSGPGRGQAGAKLKADYASESAEPGPGLGQVGTKSGLSWDHAGTKSGLGRDQVEIESKTSRNVAGFSFDGLEEKLKILELCRKEMALTDLMQAFSRSNRTKFRDKLISPLFEEKLIEWTIPDSPKNPGQKYRITELGIKFLKKHQNKKQN